MVACHNFPSGTRRLTNIFFLIVFFVCTWFFYRKATRTLFFFILFLFLEFLEIFLLILLCHLNIFTQVHQVGFSTIRRTIILLYNRYHSSQPKEIAIFSIMILLLLLFTFFNPSANPISHLTGLITGGILTPF